MSAYDRLRSDALDALTKRLGKRGLPTAERTELTDLVSHAPFPAFLGLLGTSKKPKGEVGQAFLHQAAERVAQQPAVKKQGLKTADVERALTAMFVHGATPNDALADPAVRDVVLHVALEQLAKKGGAPVTPDEAAEIVQLLSTGQFFGDLSSALAAASFAVRGLPIDLVTDVKHAPHRIPLLLVAILKDVKGTPFVPIQVLDDLRADRKLDHPPAVLRHTMRRLLDFATPARLSTTIGDLIHPDNRSVRLAIVIYARANGIPLEDSDLDLLRDHVFATDDPDLGPVLVAGVDRYLAHSDKAKLMEVLRQVAAADQT